MAPKVETLQSRTAASAHYGLNPIVNVGSNMASCKVKGRGLQMKKFTLLALAAILSLGVLVGCGGGGGGAAKTLEVIMGENGAMTYSPKELKVKKGEKVAVNLVNKDGAQAHSFLIPDFKVKSNQVAAGKTETVTFTADKTGVFDFYCDVAGHKEGGMLGKMTVSE